MQRRSDEAAGRAGGGAAWRRRSKMEWPSGCERGGQTGGRTAVRPRRPRISSADISCALAAARRAPSAPDRSRSEHPHSPVRRSRLGEYACLVTDMAVLWKEVGDTSRSRPRMRARRIRATADALTPLHSSHSACPIILMETFPREMNVLALFDPPDQAHLSLIHNQFLNSHRFCKVQQI